MLRLLTVAYVALLVGCGEQDARDEDVVREAWVTADRLHRRTCPSPECGSVGTLFLREKAVVYEDRGEWVRVSRYYDAACRGGRSQYVDSGEAACHGSNGIVDGQFAEWASSAYLSDTRPEDPAAGAVGDDALVAGSDDYGTHRAAFVRATQALISDGRCSRADFEESGGWLKSMSHRDRPVYFTYCGGMQISNRLYVDASTGELFQ